MGSFGGGERGSGGSWVSSDKSRGRGLHGDWWDVVRELEREDRNGHGDERRRGDPVGGCGHDGAEYRRCPCLQFASKGVCPPLDTLSDLRFANPELQANALLLRGHLDLADSKLEEATNAYQAALDVFENTGNRSEQAKVHTFLRDTAQKRNNFADYIQHNGAHARITEEIHGQDVIRRSAKAVAEREFRLEREQHEKHKALLYNTMPKAIADRVLRGEQVNDSIPHACVMFIDLVGFTTMSSSMSAQDVVSVLEGIFTTCDEICALYDIMKIKTIGDSYMAAAFGEQPNSRITEQPNSAVVRITLAAREIMSTIQNSDEPLQARIGLHCGPVQAGIIGTERMQYDVWGDTVNVASRMESTGEPGRIHVSERFMQTLLEEAFPIPDSPFPKRVVEIKGKGRLTTYFLDVKA